MPRFNNTETPALHGKSVQWAQGLVLVVLFTTSVFFALRFDAVTDTDVWWHMAIGRWIVEHGAIPRTEPFSAFGAGKHFEAYSWLFELFVFWCYEKLGLVGIVVFSCAMTVSITAAVHHLVRRLNSSFLLGVVTTFLAVYTMGRLYTPRPWLASILFFTLELDILMQARKTRESRELLWLPVIFVFWVNIHIQFVDGLVVLGIALAEALVATRWSTIQTNLRAAKIMWVFLGCILATLINPYGPKIYKVAYDLVAQGAALPQIPELSAISFRSLDDWCVLFFALAAAIVLARKNHPSFFEIALLAFSILTSFRSQRDVWVLAIVGAAMLATGFAEQQADPFQLTVAAIPFVVLASIAGGWFALLGKGINNTELQEKLSSSLPVRAVETIKQQRWEGPLYNDFGWGGYLIWSLQKPVSMYGKTSVYEVEMLLRSNATWSGLAGWDSDPDLFAANLIIAPRGAPLIQLLSLQPCLQSAYRDNVAEVFVSRSLSAADAASSTSAFCTARQTAANRPR
ncbi:MAG TPA: hypothetical protein VK574_15500 [Terracidiphilus sp.]|nr:hypothetical protein [Terracidiphilus sp.]